MRRPGFLDLVPLTPSDLRGLRKQLWCSARKCSLPRLHRVDWRERYLMFFGVGYILIGLGLLGDAPTQNVRANLRAATHFVPLGFYGTGWITYGVLLILAGLIVHPRRDGWLFIAAQVMPVCWATVYVLEWKVGDFHRGLYGAVTYLVFVGATYSVSQMAVPGSIQPAVEDPTV